MHPTLSYKPGWTICAWTIWEMSYSGITSFQQSFSHIATMSGWGRELLSFRVLPHWNITPVTYDMIIHPVTLCWQRADQFWFLALFLSCWMLSERAASTIFKDFGMTRPGIESATSRSQNRRPINRAIVPVKNEKGVPEQHKYTHSLIRAPG